MNKLRRPKCLAQNNDSCNYFKNFRLFVIAVKRGLLFSLQSDRCLVPAVPVLKSLNSLSCFSWKFFSIFLKEKCKKPWIGLNNSELCHSYKYLFSLDTYYYIFLIRHSTIAKIENYVLYIRRNFKHHFTEEIYSNTFSSKNLNLKENPTDNLQIEINFWKLINFFEL